MRRAMLVVALLLVAISFAIAQGPDPPSGLRLDSGPRFLLTVSKTGTGTGTVVGAGINCGADCNETISSGLQVVLFATATGGSTFAGWSGACTGTGVCTVTMSQAQAVTATFTSAVAFTRYATNNGLTSGTCQTTGTACRPDRALSLAVPDDVIGLLDGTYQGANNMLNLASFAPGISGTSGHPITVMAVNDGGVFINGQNARAPMNLSGNNWWIFQGFDVGNSSSSVVTSLNSSNNKYLRFCASNVTNTNPMPNEHVILLWNSSTNLFEDACLFGAGRNTLLEYDDSGGASGTNTYRRVWMRHEGGNDTTVGTPMPPMQIGYQLVQASLFENVIVIYDAQQTGSTTNCCNRNGTVILRDNTPGGNAGYRFRGLIAYGRDNPLITMSNSWIDVRRGNPISLTDVFVDARALPANIAALEPSPVTPGGPSLSRWTVIRASGTPASNTTNFTISNFNECTTLGACPNFYTGDTPGTGARNCLEYLDGTLTGTKLWPWRMDDRIKAALARANAAGTGGSLLAGSLGTGYAANTVTSEIVSRYGAVPPACLR